MMRSKPRPPTQQELENPHDFEAELESPAREPEAPKRTRNDAVIGEYLKQALGVTRLTRVREMKNGKTVREPISLFAAGSVPAYTLCEYKSLNFTMTCAGDIPRDGKLFTLGDAATFSNPGALPGDSDVLTFVTCCCRSYENRSGDELVGAFNVMNDHVAYRDVDKDIPEAQEAMGVLPNASIHFKPREKVERDQFALKVQVSTNTQNHARVQFHYSNPDFITSTYRVTGSPLLAPFMGKPRHECSLEEIEAREAGAIHPEDPQTLWNGLVYIPGNVCKEAGLPLYSEENAEALHQEAKRLQIKFSEVPVFGRPNLETITDEEREQSKFLNHPDDLRIRCWYAMDVNHVLSWPLDTSHDQRRSVGIYCERMDATINQKRVPVCWLLPDTTLRGLMREYTKTWANKVDTRHDWKNTVGFTVAPLNQTQGDLKDVHLSFRVQCKCIVWKNPSETPLAPKLHPDFPPLRNWVDSPFDEIPLDKLKI
jgi:hypothetical protein